MTDINLLEFVYHSDASSTERILEHSLPKLMAAFDAIKQIDVYRVADSGLVLWHSENGQLANGQFLTFRDNPTYENAIQEREIVTDEAQKQLIAPLMYQKRVFGLLVMHYAAHSPASDILQDFLHELSLILHSKQTDDLLQQQLDISRQLNRVQSLSELATIIARTMARSQQFVVVNRFDYDADGQVNGAEVVASANRKQSFGGELPIAVNVSALQDLHDLLKARQSVLISDLDADERFTTDAKRWLQSQKAKSAYLLALPLSEARLAFITLLDTHSALALSVDEQDLYANMAEQATAIINRQQLLERSQSSAAESSGQVQILRALNRLIAREEELSEVEVLQQAADLLLEATQVEHVGIVMNQADTSTVVSEAPQRGLIGKSVEIGDNSLRKILEDTREAFVSENVAEDSSLPDSTRAVLLESGIQSIVVLPVFDINGELLGSVGLDYFTRQAQIDLKMVEFAQTIITQVTLSLQKVRLLRESQQQAAQLQQITAFGRALGTFLSTEDILDTALQHIPQLLEVDYVAIMSYDLSLNRLRRTASYWQGQQQINQDAEIVNLDDYPIIQDVWDTRSFSQIGDLKRGWTEHYPMSELSSLMTMPLSSAGILLGILVIGSQNSQHFNLSDSVTFQQIGNQLAATLSNATAYMQSQLLARKKTHASEINAVLQKQTTVKDILRVTAYELGTALAAKRVRIKLGYAPTENGDS